MAFTSIDKWLDISMLIRQVVSLLSLESWMTPGCYINSTYWSWATTTCITPARSPAWKAAQTALCFLFYSGALFRKARTSSRGNVQMKNNGMQFVEMLDNYYGGKI